MFSGAFSPFETDLSLAQNSTSGLCWKARKPGDPLVYACLALPWTYKHMLACLDCFLIMCSGMESHHCVCK